MDAKNIKDSRQRLSNEYQNLVQAINRNRLAAKELAVERPYVTKLLEEINGGKTLLQFQKHETVFCQGDRAR